jgi:hypothetical protein
MGSNELEIGVELSTGILPGGTFTAKLRRTWDNRASALAAQLVDESGLSLEQIERVVLENDRLADVLANTSDRVVRVGDAFYRAALGRLVAAALRGDVAIDRAEELVDQLLTLDGSTVRVMAAIYGGLEQARNDGRAVEVERIARAAGIAESELQVALSRLAAGGFVERTFDVQTEIPRSGDDPAESEVIAAYESTDWGRSAYEVCMRHLEVALDFEQESQTDDQPV